MTLPNYDAPLDFTNFHNIIDGKHVDTINTRGTLNPATLEDLPQVPVSTIDHVNQAVQAAQKATKSWAAVPLEERIGAIKRFADSLEAHLDDFAQMLLKEQGKPVSPQPKPQDL
jgi:acyl-CoA reductase-like NAD-dependent aldehyde dehydrogenase